jgi:hypothetical protein
VAADTGADGARQAVLAIDAPLAAGAARVLLRQAEILLAGGYLQIICDVSGRPDLSLIDVLAKLTLLTQRSQAGLRIRAVGGGSTGLADLLALTGLDCLNALELRRQAETGE